MKNFLRTGVSHVALAAHQAADARFAALLEAEATLSQCTALGTRAQFAEAFDTALNTIQAGEQRHG